jgi:patatin-like phospholipase/acyl hydrolase
MKILALDGGGVFGFAQAEIMSKAMCSDKFDCFVGTSIGSAIAAALATNRVVNRQFFDEWMPKIFERSFLRRLNPLVSKYPTVEIINALQSVFGGTLLGNAKKPLFVTAANLAAKRLKVFYSGDPSDSGLLLWQVIRSATAAETYFEPYCGYADGGVFANNPSAVGIAAACKVLGAEVEDIELLSIGAGNRPQNSGSIPRTLIG